MRKFEIQVLDGDQSMVDRFVLDKVLAPSGLGFTQQIDVVETKTIDYIVDRTLKKKDIKLSIIFEEPASYQKANSFRTWYSINISKKVVLKYDDGYMSRYMDIVIKEFNLSEINTGANVVPIVIQPLSPFYLLKTRKIISAIKIIGKSYNYSYPYAYGGGQLEDNEIDNKFFEPTPLAVRINGPISNPTISLRSEDDEIYATVKFNNVTLGLGQSILVDAINTKILFFASENVQGIDYYNYIDQSKHTFLYANPGTSELVANLTQEDAGASIQVVYVEYVL